MQSYCCREILKHIQPVREYGDYIKLFASEATQTLTYVDVHNFSKTIQKKNNATFSHRTRSQEVSVSKIIPFIKDCKFRVGYESLRSHNHVVVP